MYKSPIDIIYGQMETQLEGTVLKAVQNVGVDVDKEELIRALQYDRHQYSKGYHDAMDSIVRCENCTHCAYTDSLNRDRGYCGVIHLYVKPTDFCSHGERRSNA